MRSSPEVLTTERRILTPSLAAIFCSFSQVSPTWLPMKTAFSLPDLSAQAQTALPPVLVLHAAAITSVALLGAQKQQTWKKGRETKRCGYV
jgi:hypothetical protein